MRSTSGSTGERPGDAEPLLLAAGEASAAGVEPVLHLVPQRGTGAAPPRRSRAVGSCGIPFSRSPAATLSQIDMVGNGLGLLEHHARSRRAQRRPGRRRRARGRCPSSAGSPSTRAPGMSSCIRLRQRRKVDLPQPDGPMSRRHRPGGNGEVHAMQGVVRAVPGVEVLDGELGLLRGSHGHGVLGRRLHRRVEGVQGATGGEVTEAISWAAFIGEHPAAGSGTGTARRGSRRPRGGGAPGRPSRPSGASRRRG